MNSSCLSIGCDPELFLKISGKFKSVHDLLPGTKEQPYQVPYGAIQVDGVAAEFNIYPALNQEQFLFHIKEVKDALYEQLCINMVERGIRGPFALVAEPVAYFDQKYFDTLPDTPKLLGCQPDFDAYSGAQNDPPCTVEPFRTGAGHIHIGWGEYLDPNDPEHFITCRDVVRQLDAVLYPLADFWDKDTKRRTLYGQKGSFRPRTYGVEYRPLSNAWLKDKDTIKLVYEVTMKATQQYFKGERMF